LGGSLLAKLKTEKLVLDWRKQQTTRAGVLTTIKEVLDELPRAYTKELYEQNAMPCISTSYDAYTGQGRSIYAAN
jgi:type I restriction enzyme, R subunit